MANELKFDQFHHLKIFYSVFHMFKYGVQDMDKKNFIVSSPFFKEIFDSIRDNYAQSAAQSHLIKPEPIANIEDLPDQFEVMKNYVRAHQKGISYWEDFNWDQLTESERRECIIILASPYIIRNETIDSLLLEFS
jgi:hypothetical protein